MLTTTLDQVLDRPRPRIVVDLSGVEFCDSTGLSAFVVGHNQADRDGGWVRLAAPSAWMARLLDTVGLTGGWRLSQRGGALPTGSPPIAVPVPAPALRRWPSPLCGDRAGSLPGGPG